MRVPCKPRARVTFHLFPNKRALLAFGNEAQPSTPNTFFLGNLSLSVPHPEASFVSNHPWSICCSSKP